MKNAQSAQLKTIFPGKKIQLAKDLEVTIKPMYVRQLRTFQDAIRSLVEKAQTIESTSMGGVLAQLAPMAVDTLFDALNECVEGIDLEDPNLPQWMLPKIAQEWLLESFGTEEKIRPWIAAIEEVICRVTGKKVDLWKDLTSKFSQISFQPDTASPTSSTTGT